jgi:hypothetical protein
MSAEDPAVSGWRDTIAKALRTDTERYEQLQKDYNAVLLERDALAKGLDEMAIRLTEALDGNTRLAMDHAVLIVEVRSLRAENERLKTPLKPRGVGRFWLTDKGMAAVRGGRDA